VSRRSRNSFSSDVIKRFLQALIETGPIGKTRLSGKVGINYETCIKYVTFLMMLNWIGIMEVDDRTEHVYITPEGIEHLRKLEGESSGKVFDNKTNTNMSLRALKETRARNETKTQYRRRSTRGNKKNIVIIDDDESSLIMYRAFLEQCGTNTTATSSFNVKIFSQPDQALRYLVNNPNSYDLVVLDIRMPKMSGFRLFQGLKATNPNAKVIFLTSLDVGPELLEIFPDIKPSQFIRKPVDRDKLVKAILEAIS
jgi:CheY-like chemotaxis protein/predicted transcriptional regulator